MNHKRRRPKHQRAGCLLCKPWKDERGATMCSAEKPSVRRRLQEHVDQRESRTEAAWRDLARAEDERYTPGGGDQ